jgi:hypothetical protein
MMPHPACVGQQQKCVPMLPQAAGRWNRNRRMCGTPAKKPMCCTTSCVTQNHAATSVSTCTLQQAAAAAWLNCSMSSMKACERMFTVKVLAVGQWLAAHSQVPQLFTESLCCAVQAAKSNCSLCCCSGIASACMLHYLTSAHSVFIAVGWAQLGATIQLLLPLSASHYIVPVTPASIKSTIECLWP